MYAPLQRKQHLNTEMILTAYKSGLFPMAEGKDGAIGFFHFEPRGIIPLDDRFTIRRSLAQALKKEPFEIRFDTSFEEVIRGCARYDELPDEDVWISEEMIDLYTELYHQGIAHSVESWRNDKLVGGLYGLVIGSAFCGESMFSRMPNASQAALIALVDHLRKQGFTLLDAQMPTEHLEQFGLYSVSQGQYLGMLADALGNSASWK
jgi:leucyl/phenylalanyl-tRNA--protein transferase